MPPARRLPSRQAAARALAAAGRSFYARGWVLGTSGNFSAVIGRTPLRLLITPSGAHKGTLDARAFLQIDGQTRVCGPAAGRPSAEARLHLAIVAERAAGAVLHTHSVWSTVLSDRCATDGWLDLTGFEMLKGLAGVNTHTHHERVPILPNDQDMTRLAGSITETLRAHPGAHAFLLERHGLYTWGASIDEAARHVEILEFLLEAESRRLGCGEPPMGAR